MPTLEQRFGWVVRRLRKRAGVSQEKLADLAGLHRTHIGLIERGLRGANLRVLERLAGALGTTMAKLMAALEAQGDEPGPEPAGPKPGRPRKPPAPAPQSPTGRTAKGRPPGPGPAGK